MHLACLCRIRTLPRHLLPAYNNHVVFFAATLLGRLKEVIITSMLISTLIQTEP